MREESPSAFAFSPVAGGETLLFPEFCLLAAEDGGAELEDVLAARDQREALRLACADQIHPQLVVKLNLAGSIKRDLLSDRFFSCELSRLRQTLKREGVLFLQEEALHTKAGASFLATLAGIDAKTLKALCLLLEEENPAARLLDIDVYDGSGQILRREDFALPPRRCLLCSAAALDCAHSQRHDAAALRQKTRELLREYFFAAYGRRLRQAALKALLYEISAAPKPGLVDRFNSGAHGDMDYFSFIDSSVSLLDYFEKAVGLGFKENDDAACFFRLQRMGLEAESQMFAVTGGVNTQKGLIFSLGLLLCGAARVFRENLTDATHWRDPFYPRADAILAAAAALAAIPYEREKLRLRQTDPQAKPVGARAEAYKGFPLAEKIGLPVIRMCYKNGLNSNETALRALVALMAQVVDSNLIRRGGRKALASVQARAGEIHGECLGQDELTQALGEWDKELSRRGLSAGGAADLLALSFFLFFAETVCD